MNKTYTINPETGKLSIFEQNPQIEQVLGLFLYKEGEDITKIDGETPVIFLSPNTFVECLNGDSRILTERKNTVVIRWINLVK